MKIAVLCGGLSPERNVSISSGTKIAGALKENGHQVVLLDMFFGLEDYTGDIARVFDDPPALGGTHIDESAPDLEAVRAQRKLQSPRRSTCSASPTPAAAISAAPSPWIRT